MLRLFKPILLMVIPLFMASCLDDDENVCGVYLDFIYDHNMEYADSFNPQVNAVDVYVFDEEGTFLFSKHAELDELVNRKRMLLYDNLPFGTYQILTIGGLCDKFRLSDGNNNDCSAGITSLEELKLALVRESGEVSHEFPPVWFGETVVVNYQADLSVWPVHLIKDTNNFRITLSRIGENNANTNNTRSAASRYTFEIVTPEAAVYSYQNEPLFNEKVIYKPWQLVSGTQPETTSVADINSCRLFSDHEDGYRLIVRSVKTYRILWEYDLMELLAHTKPAKRPDGSDLSMQEYLDRQSEWNISILHKGDVEEEENQDAFVAVSVKINGWIVWLNDIDF